MSDIDHEHVCCRCGISFTCWCTQPVDGGDRMCPTCGEQYRRLKDAPRSKSTKLVYSGAQRKHWR